MYRHAAKLRFGAMLSEDATMDATLVGPSQTLDGASNVNNNNENDNDGDGNAQQRTPKRKGDAKAMFKEVAGGMTGRRRRSAEGHQRERMTLKEASEAQISSFKRAQSFGGGARAAVSK